MKIPQYSHPCPPEPPPERVIREGVGVFCNRCGSTKSRTWMFGSRKCDNEKCSGTREDKLNYLIQ
jgi:hypothetical protein